jgi:sugar O-acyltransferase (sialic acid O-acetyltransferase NeuD family)
MHDDDLPMPIVIFGDGELAEVACFYFDNDSRHKVVAFTVDNARLSKDSLLGRPVVPFEEISARFPPDAYLGFVAVGYSGVNRLRMDKCHAFRDKGYRLASYVSSRATTFADLNIGWNAFILEDNTIQPFVHIGNGVTLWSGNHIGHHATIGDFAFISSHVVISGGVQVGERTFMGVNSTTSDHITIGARCVVGAGALVSKDAEDESVLTTEPAKLARVPSSRLRGF